MKKSKIKKCVLSYFCYFKIKKKEEKVLISFLFYD